ELGDASLARREPLAGRRAAADPRELGPRLPRPERSAELVERREGGPERVARVPLLPGSPLNGAPHGLRPRELEGLPDAIVQLDRAFEMLERLHWVLQSADEPSTTGRGGQGERPVELDAPAFEGHQRLLGASELPQADERLDVVGHEREHAGLDDAPGAEQVGERLKVSAWRPEVSP